MNSIPVIRQCLLPLFCIIYLMCSIYLMIPFAIGCVGSGYTGLNTSPYGVPSRPIVYRVLIPAIARTVRSVVPEAIEKPLTEKMIHWRDSDEGKETVKNLFLRPPPLSDGLIFETAVTAFVAYLTLLAFLWMFYTFTRALFPESLSYALLAPIIALQLIPALTVGNGYMYDFAEVFFSCALFYLLLKQRWGMYMVTFFFATLNKETTIFIFVFFVTWFYPRLPRKQFLSLLIQQGIIYGVVKGGLTLYFLHYPGDVIGRPVTLAGNLNALFTSGDFIYFALAAGLMAYRWKEKPAFLRGSLPMVLAHTAVFFTVCIPFEYRDFYWSLPVMILYATHSLIAGTGIADHPIFRPRT